MATIHRVGDSEVESRAPAVPPPPSRFRAARIETISPEELMRRNRAAIDLLDTWETGGDEQEQRETMRVLREALGPPESRLDPESVPMKRLLLLDEGPLSLVTNPKESEQSRRCKEWLASVLAHGVRVMVPAIADYELRRELLRANRLKGIDRLDALIDRLGYLEVDGDMFGYAATLWAWARTEGIPTAEDTALDCDVILAAQAQIAARDSGDEVIVVTTNVAHLKRFVAAQTWDKIAP